MLPHHLDGDRPDRLVAQFVVCAEIKIQHAVEPELAHAKEFSSRQMLSKKHAEHRRMIVLPRRFAADINAGELRVARQNKPRLFPRRAKNQMDLVALGLENAVDPRAAQRRLQFACNGMDHYAVVWHRYTSKSIGIAFYYKALAAL